MRELTNMGARVIVAMLAGVALVGVAALASDLLPPGGLPDALGGWPMLAALVALLCGVCSLGMSLGLCLRPWPSRRLVSVGLVAAAIIWGVCLSVAGLGAGWERLLADVPGFTLVGAALAMAGAPVIVWLLLFVALTGLLTGLRRKVSATVRALTPLWLTPLWGGLVGVVYGALAAVVYTPRPPHSYYGLETSPWDGLRAGLTLGLGAGLILGLTLALAQRMALIVRPIWDEGEIAATSGQAATS
ncbi:MAG TPA: hypothetical protein VFN78_06200 [Ktedonobacterales bacterium]|nr:hypothetical protein [Ktedonobacterales bacterium]